MEFRKIRYLIFLREIFVMSWTSFGGPQAHLAHFICIFCEKRGYLSESALLEIYALCQILPGPTSTQTITGIAYRLGGVGLAYLTLVIWVFPSLLIMTLAAIFITYLEQQQVDFSFARFTQAIAVGFIFSAAWQIAPKVIQSKISAFLVVFSTIVAYFYHSQWFLPLLIIFGGVITMRNFEKYPKIQDKKLQIRWRNFTYFVLVFAILTFLSEFTRRYSFGLPFRLAENFYRTGSIIFGGGQVLVPLMLTEFVYIKKLITREEFDLGYNFNQILPGPTFAFSAFIGAMAMRDFGVWGQVLGAFLASFGVFMPGTLLIFFVMQFWDELKKYRPVRAALEGINAVSIGLVFVAVILMGQAIFEQNSINEIFLDIGVVIGTFLILHFTKIPPPIIVIVGLILGYLL
jgi:chromate transporter